MTKKSLEKIQEVFINNFCHLHLQIPDDDLINRAKGSMAFGSGKLFYIFGEEEGREYFEYYSHHRIGGNGHGKIYEDGESLSLPTLETGFAYNSKIPGDAERKRAENAEEYRKTLDDLNAKGMFSSGGIPGSLVINSYIMAEELEKGKKPDEE